MPCAPTTQRKTRGKWTPMQTKESVAYHRCRKPCKRWCRLEPHEHQELPRLAHNGWRRWWSSFGRKQKHPNDWITGTKSNPNLSKTNLIGGDMYTTHRIYLFPHSSVPWRPPEARESRWIQRQSKNSWRVALFYCCEEKSRLGERSRRVYILLQTN